MTSSGPAPEAPAPWRVRLYSQLWKIAAPPGSLVPKAVFLMVSRSSAQDAPTSLTQQNRTRMLGRLRHSNSEVLTHLLKEITWIELGLTAMPNAVQNAINRLKKTK